MSTTTPDPLGEALVRECRRRLDESLERIRACLSHLTTEETWRRPNEHTVSIGNLVLHLAGNVRQWIVSALGAREDVRNRPAEFTERGPIPAAELLARLEAVMAEAAAVIDRLDAGSLLERRQVQGFEETGLSILVHVVEHFSYHTGQIAYAVKAGKDLDLGFYRGVNLDRKGP
jgi:uncharacterized damage-inducible protein DinB